MARKLTIPQRLEAKRITIDYYMKGYGSPRIANMVTQQTGVSISTSTAHTLIKEVMADLKVQYENKIDDLFWVQLEKYNNLEAEMWEAWELSKTQRKKTVSRRKGEPVVNQQNNTVRSVKTKEVYDQEELTDGRGDPRYAAIILDCIDRRMQWLGKLKFGVEAETPQNIINNTNNNITLVVRAAQRSPKMQALDAQFTEVTNNEQQEQ